MFNWSVNSNRTNSRKNIGIKKRTNNWIANCEWCHRRLRFVCSPLISDNQRCVYETHICRHNYWDLNRIPSTIAVSKLDFVLYGGLVILRIWGTITKTQWEHWIVTLIIQLGCKLLHVDTFEKGSEKSQKLKSVVSLRTKTAFPLIKYHQWFGVHDRKRHRTQSKISIT